MQKNDTIYQNLICKIKKGCCESEVSDWQQPYYYLIIRDDGGNHNLHRRIRRLLHRRRELPVLH